MTSAGGYAWVPGCTQEGRAQQCICASNPLELSREFARRRAPAEEPEKHDTKQTTTTSTTTTRLRCLQHQLNWPEAIHPRPPCTAATPFSVHILPRQSTITRRKYECRGHRFGHPQHGDRCREEPRSGRGEYALLTGWWCAAC